MSRLTPGPASARHRHDQTAPQFGRGWCRPCYEAGSFTLALDPERSECALHDDLSNPQTATKPTLLRPLRRSRCPRGRAAHTPPTPTRPPTARVLAHGRRRAAGRLTAATYQPHPEWRHVIDPGWRVLTDQTEALRLVQDLIDAQDWRTDKRTSWLRILRRLVHSMDWSTGLVTALTTHRLGDASDRSPRTVSRVLAWARDIGLLVVAEPGASAEFLDTPHGRTPTYALVTRMPLAEPPPPQEPTSSHHPKSQLTRLVDENGDLSVSHVDITPLNGERLNATHQQPRSWLLFRIPESPTERALATHRLLHELDLMRAGVSCVPLWRTWALLRPWWDAGASPAGLLYAIHHHPDHPTHSRGDALRGTRDPLRVLGHRLQPWQGRLTELPPTVRGIRGDYQNKPLTATPTTPPATPAARPEVRRAARAALATHLQRLRQRRAHAPSPYP